MKHHFREKVTSTMLLALFFVSNAEARAESITLNSKEMHKASEHVTFGIRDFGLTYLSFENPSEKNGNNIEGYKQVSVWDKGKLVTVSVSDEEWQETRVRTTQGCLVGRRLSKAKFTCDVKPQAQPGSSSKNIEGTDVKLVSINYYEERKAQ